ncbi:M56 family metallopeptidase [Caulobacter segnis]|uniref:M56 family metallopeptidase n=1 Tax=Caulobacter segnis TaxID=88688 RepID=UPI0021DA0EF9|nr:M56 family metallopeptidase [Caulobacter segnis]UAL11429.1 hypothetical protein K8940_03800 [Caulobacter segnis]
MHPLLASTAMGLVAAWPVGVLGLGLGRLVERLTDDPRPRAAAWSLAYALPAGALAATVALTFAPRPAAPAAVAPPVVAATRVTAAAPAWTPEAELADRLAWSLVVLSSAGLLARGWRLERGRRRLAAIRAQAEPCQDASLVEAVRQRAARLGVKVPGVRISAEIAAPLLAGARRPTILLPKALVETTDTQRLALICGHELAHLRRGDNWRIPAEEALAGLFWLTPPVGALRGRMLAAREAVCDLTALDGAAPEVRRDYARVLVEALRMSAAPSPTFESAFTGRDRGLVGMRLSAILRPGGGVSAVRVGLAVALGGVLTAATGAGSLALADQARRLAPPEAASAEVEQVRQASEATRAVAAQDAADATTVRAMAEDATPAAEAAPMQAQAAPAAEPVDAVASVTSPAPPAPPAPMAGPAPVSPPAPAPMAAPMAAMGSLSPRPDPRPQPDPRPNPQPTPNPQPRFDARAAAEPSIVVRTDVQNTVRITVPANAGEDLSRRIKVLDPSARSRATSTSRTSVGVTITNERNDPWSR